MAKRGRLEIMRDILKIIQDNQKIKTTPLLRKTNISSSSFKEYYTELLGKEFIKETHSKDGKHVTLTEKGTRFLQKYLAIVNFIDEFDL